MTNLTPCPHCGGEMMTDYDVCLLGLGTQSSTVESHWIAHKEVSKGCAFNKSVIYRTEAEAIAAWNRRMPECIIVGQSPMSKSGVLFDCATVTELKAERDALKDEIALQESINRGQKSNIVKLFKRIEEEDRVERTLAEKLDRALEALR